MLVQWKNRFAGCVSDEMFTRMWVVAVFEKSWKMVFRVLVGFFELMSETLRRSTCGTAEKMLDLLYNKGMSKPSKALTPESIWKKGLECKITRSMLGKIAKADAASK